MKNVFYIEYASLETQIAFIMFAKKKKNKIESFSMFGVNSIRKFNIEYINTLLKCYICI